MPKKIFLIIKKRTGKVKERKSKLPSSQKYLRTMMRKRRKEQESKLKKLMKKLKTKILNKMRKMK
jgi:hypothetical protein